MASPGAVSGALGPVSLLFDEATDFAAHQYIVNIFAFVAGKTFFLATETTEEHINTDSLVATLTKVCACVCACVCLHDMNACVCLLNFDVDFQTMREWEIPLRQVRRFICDKASYHGAALRQMAPG